MNDNGTGEEEEGPAEPDPGEEPEEPESPDKPPPE